jgi:hypothetical protein
MLQETEDGDALVVERIAALDIGKAEVACCVRVPDPGGSGRRAQEVATYSTMTGSLQTLADRLRALRVSRVVMEATSDYWKPVYYLLEAAGFEVWLVNAKDVRHLPGRAKTDTIDAVSTWWAVQGGRTRHAAAQLRAAGADPAAAGPDPISDRSGRRAWPGEEPGGEAAGGRPDQAVGGGQ